MTFVPNLVLWTLLGTGLLLACGSAPAAPSGGTDATAALSWSREGGFAGFCDSLKVTASGDVTASTCRTTGDKKGKLSSDDLARLKAWQGTFGKVDISSADGGSADGMTVKLTLAGEGREQPSEAQKQELLQWAQRVYTQTQG